jgi:hypothetical protein
LFIQTEIPYMSYNNPGWTVIRLVDYFEPTDTMDAYEACRDMSAWCGENLLDGTWERNGVTKYSFRFQFRDPVDALAFKIKFVDR